MFEHYPYDDRLCRPIYMSLADAFVVGTGLSLFTSIVYVFVRLFAGAADSMWLVGEMVLLNFALAMIFTYAGMAYAMKKVIAKKGVTRAARLLVNRKWQKKSPSSLTRVILQYAGLDLADILSNSDEYQLREW